MFGLWTWLCHEPFTGRRFWNYKRPWWLWWCKQLSLSTDDELIARRATNLVYACRTYKGRRTNCQFEPWFWVGDSRWMNVFERTIAAIRSPLNSQSATNSSRDVRVHSTRMTSCAHHDCSCLCTRRILLRHPSVNSAKGVVVADASRASADKVHLAWKNMWHSFIYDSMTPSDTNEQTIAWRESYSCPPHGVFRRVFALPRDFVLISNASV